MLNNQRPGDPTQIRLGILNEVFGSYHDVGCST